MSLVCLLNLPTTSQKAPFSNIDFDLFPNSSLAGLLPPLIYLTISITDEEIVSFHNQLVSKLAYIED